MLRFLCYLTAAGILWATEAGIAFLRTPAGIPSVIGLVIFFNFVWPPIREAVKVPFNGEIKIVSAEVGGLGYVGWSHDYGHTITLTIESTLETVYHADAAICSIRGPVFHDPIYNILDAYPGARGYLGERRILTTLIAVDNTSLGEHHWFNHANIREASRPFGVGRPEPHAQKVDYISTMPADFFSGQDTVEWCKIGTDLRMVAADLHLATDIHGTVLNNRVTWINGDPGFPVERLIDKNVRGQIKAAIP
jgi:hypothetical protein